MQGQEKPIEIFPQLDSAMWKPAGPHLYYAPTAGSQDWGIFPESRSGLAGVGGWGVRNCMKALGLKGQENKEAKNKCKHERPEQALLLPHSPTPGFVFPCPICITMTPTTCALWFFRTGTLHLLPTSSGAYWKQPSCNCTEPMAWIGDPTPWFTVDSVWPWAIPSLLCTHFCPNDFSLSVSIDNVNRQVTHVALLATMTLQDSSSQLCFSFVHGTLDLTFSDGPKATIPRAHHNPPNSVCAYFSKA